MCTTWTLNAEKEESELNECFSFVLGKIVYLIRMPDEEELALDHLNHHLLITDLARKLRPNVNEIRDLEESRGTDRSQREYSCRKRNPMTSAGPYF